MPARAQSSTAEYLPEIDVHLQPVSSIRVVFQVKRTREGGDPVQTELGPSVEFYLKPLLRLKDATAWDLDKSKSRALVFSVGYRCLLAPNKPTVNRFEPVVTFHYLLKGRILISDRNRADLDWSSGPFVWRYRNKLTVERRLTIRGYHPGPYVSVESFYQSKYEKWSSTALYAGCQFPIAKHVALDSYYEHENNTGGKTNQQINAAGLVLNLHF
jgi:hypothetical protein